MQRREKCTQTKVEADEETELITYVIKIFQL